MRKSLVCIVVTLLVFGLAGLAAAQLTPEQALGKKLYFDKSLSINANQSCASCHHPKAGFAEPDRAFPVSEGSIAGQFGGRNAPSSAYAAFSPFFYWDGVAGLYVGGQFWDGRANTLAAQAAGPPTNPVEMAMPDKTAVVAVLAGNPRYVTQFNAVYNCDLPGATTTPAGVEHAYELMAKAIGEYEKTTELNAFNSKWDYVQAGLAQFTPAEDSGFGIFKGKAKCDVCHIATPTLAPDGVSQIPALFTDFTYDNLGIPKNVNVAASLNKVDRGLGGRADIAAKDPNKDQLGKFKVMTLRNIARTAPYGHNGVFVNLRQIIKFYATRDTLGLVCADNNDPGFATTCWPVPEVQRNMNTTELGSISLSNKDINDLIAFLNTLTDGYVDPISGLPPGPLPPVVFPPMP